LWGGREVREAAEAIWTADRVTMGVVEVMVPEVGMAAIRMRGLVNRAMMEVGGMRRRGKAELDRQMSDGRGTRIIRIGMMG